MSDMKLEQVAITSSGNRNDKKVKNVCCGAAGGPAH